MSVVRVVRDRGGLIEAVHEVDLAIWTGDGGGDAGRTTHLRSAAKPVQALACLVTGAADRFGFTVPELSLACASHNGEPFHVDAARRFAVPWSDPAPACASSFDTPHPTSS